MKKIFLYAITLLLTPYVYADCADVSCQRMGCVEVGADWLYWKSFQDNMEYGNLINITAGSSVAVQAQLLSPQFTASSGFTIYADYLFCNTSFQLGARFTRLGSQVGRLSTSVSPTGLAQNAIQLNPQNFPILQFFSTNNVQLSSLSSKMTSAVNWLDLDLAYAIELHRNFGISPHFGLRGVWLSQKLNLVGFAPSVTGGVADGDFAAQFRGTYDGYGVEGGLNAYMRLCWGLSLTGNLGYSLLYAHIAVDEDYSLANGLAPRSENQDESIFHLSSMIDGYIGLQYESCCWGHWLNINLGWEQHIITSANHFSLFNYANLTLQGLTLGGSLTF